MTTDKKKLAVYLQKIEYYGNKLLEDKTHNGDIKKPMNQNEVKKILKDITHYGGVQKQINPSEVKQKLDIYKKKRDHYKQLILDDSTKDESKNQEGGAESGVKFIIFNNNKFKNKNINIEDQKRDNFLSSSKLSQIIGNKSYIIDENSTNMHIFRGNRLSILNKVTNMILPKNDDSDDDDIQLKDNIKLNLKFNEVSYHSEANNYRKIFHQVVHENIPSHQRHKFNRFMVVSFGTGVCRNTLLYLSDEYKS